ncbi:MAG: hypothetical protein PHD83_04970 [Caldisericia bacterium]|nr:hypothetical protein [Caldisericia bacterium]
MEYFDETSLSNTVNNVLHAELFSETIPSREKEKIALWISKRRGIKGSYHGLFAPTEADFKEGVHLFTGEPITSGAATSHILGEEAMGLLQRWNLTIPEVQQALTTAKKSWRAKIAEDEEIYGRPMGMFCCGKCTNAYWRGLLNGSLDKADTRLPRGLEILKSLRDGKGKWRRFPFYNTVWVLYDIHSKASKEELHYVAPLLERYISRKPTTVSSYYSRRLQIIQNILKTI